MKRTVMTAMLAAMTVACLAQGFPGDGQGGPPPGGPPQGFGGPGFGMRMGPPSVAMLAMRRDVQADLNLTSEQVAKLQALRPRGPRMGGPGGPGGGPGGAPDDQGGPPPGGDQGGPPPGGGQGGPPPGMGPGGPGGPPNFRAMAEKIKGILTTEQWSRLKGIDVQLNGNAAVLDPEIQKDLAVTDSQRKAIRDLAEKQGDANRSVFDKVRDGEIEPEQARTSIKHNQDALKAEIGKVLTSDQKAKLKEMEGKRFVPEERGPGEPGGLGGPGGFGGPGGGPGGG